MPYHHYRHSWLPGPTRGGEKRCAHRAFTGCRTLPRVGSAPQRCACGVVLKQLRWDQEHAVNLAEMLCTRVTWNCTDTPLVCDLL